MARQIGKETVAAGLLCPMTPRQQVWQKLAGEWKPRELAATAEECTLQELEPRIQAILEGKHRGRTVINLLAS